MPSRKLLDEAHLDDRRRERRLAFLDFGPADEANLAEIAEFARAHVDEIVEAFYTHLCSFDETRTILGSEERIAQLKGLQRAYFLEMVERRLDADYFESRLRVGDIHQRADLHPEWYFGAYNLYLRLVMEWLVKDYGEHPDRLVELIGSLSKVIFLDMGLAIDAYIMGGYVERALAQEYRRMAEVAERTLRDKEEVEGMKAELTHMIVHDLKGPLGGILTTTQLALRKRGAVPEAQARHFEQIQRSARGLLLMIENLLEIDQMQDKRLALRIEPVDLTHLLEECVAEFAAAAEIAGQTLVVAVSDDVPMIATDRWLLRRILSNLVVNAIRHSGGGSRILLEAEVADGWTRIRVSDSGRGIAAEDLETLFLRQRRARRGQSREDTGMGLVFCKMAVEALGGTIAVESAAGSGATFVISLPSALTSG